MPDHLQQIAAPSTEAKQMTAQRIAMQNLLHPQRQTGKALSHVSVAGRKPHPHAARHRNHRRTSASNTRRSASTSTSKSTRTRYPLASSISMMPSFLRRRLAAAVDDSSTCFGGDRTILTGISPATLVSVRLQSSLRHLNNWLT